MQKFQGLCPARVRLKCAVWWPLILTHVPSWGRKIMSRSGSENFEICRFTRISLNVFADVSRSLTDVVAVADARRSSVLETMVWALRP